MKMRKGSLEDFKDRAIGFVQQAVDNGATKISEPASERVQFVMVPIDQIEPDPNQPRKSFDAEKLQELADSISQDGVLEPLIVCQLDDGAIRLIAGERRLKAAKLAGLSEVPATIKAAGQARRIALIENMQREDLNPIEEAEGLLALKTADNLTDAELAKLVSKPRTVITEALSLNKLPDHIAGECRTSDNCSKSLLLNVVRAQSTEIQDKLWEAIKTEKVTTVKQARSFLEPTQKKAKGRPKHHRYLKRTSEWEVLVTIKKGTGTAAVREALQATLKSLE